MNGITYSAGGVACAIPDILYNDSQTIIGVVTPVVLEAPNAPTYYRLSSSNGVTLLTDNEWHITASMNLGYGKKLEVDETFTP